MEQDEAERLAVIENQIELHAKQLEKHDDKIAMMSEHDIKQDAQLEKLCHGQEKNQRLTEKNTRMLEEIHTQGRTTKWLVASIATGIPVLITLWTSLKGLFA